MNKERALLLVLAAAMFTHIMDFMIMMPLGSQLMRVFDVSPQQFSFLVASYTVTAGISGFLAAFVIDRYDRKKTLLFVYSGFALGTLACAFAEHYAVLLAARSIAGAFGGIIGAIILAIVSDAVPLERRASAIGLVMASFGVASVVGVPFGLFLASEWSWHYPFLLLGILSIALCGLMVITVPALTQHLGANRPLRPGELIQQIFGSRNARLGLMFTSLLMLGHFTIIPFVAPYMVGNVGFTELQLAYIYFVGGLCTLFFSPWVGRMADRYGRLQVFTVFGTLAIIPILIITNLMPVPIWVALIITAFFFICSNGRMVPSTTMETAVIKPHLRGSYMSIRSSVQQLSSGLASLIAGAIVVEQPTAFAGNAKALINYHYVGAIAALFSVAAIFVARRLNVEQGA